MLIERRKQQFQSFISCAWGIKLTGLILLRKEVLIIVQIQLTLDQIPLRFLAGIAVVYMGMLFSIHLEAANSKLARYIKMAGVLEAEKERLRILEQLQAALIKKIEDAVVRVDELQREYLTHPAYNAEIRIAANSLRSIYRDVRESVNQISAKEI